MKKIILVCAFILSLTLVGCGSSSKDSLKESSSAMTEKASSDLAYDYKSADNGTKSEENVSETEDTNEKKIETAYLTVETEEYDKSEKTLKDLIVKYNGNVQYSTASKDYEGKNRYSHQEIRIPKEKFQGFLDECGTIGNITNQNTGSEDVTSQYTDLNARLKVLKAEEERYVELMNATSSMDDILKIEEHLSDIRYDIERYTSYLNNLNDKVDYGTVAIDLNEVSKLTVENESFFEKVKNAFSDSLKSLKVFFTTLLLIIVVLIPYLIIGAIIAAIVLYILKKKKGGKH